MQQELCLIWQYIRAIFKDWIGWMSGSIGLALTIGAQLMADFASPGWFFAAGIFAFLLACYRAWRVERVQRDANKAIKFKVDRWIASGQELFDSLEAIQPPPSWNATMSFKVPREMTDHIIEWQNEVDAFVKEQFPDFIKYVDRAGIPPFPPILNDVKDRMFSLWRREIGVRVERLKEKSAELDGG